MANFNFNKVILGGRLVATPELKATPSGVMVTQITVAVSRKYGGKDESGNNAAPQADFIRVIAWRQLAEFVCKYFTKGKMLGIAGSIQTRSWQAQDRTKRFATEVIAEEAYFVGDKIEKAPEANTLPMADFTFSEQANNEELPF